MASKPDDHLAPYEVKALELGESKGAGCYGAVYRVKVNGFPCIAKRLHDILVGQVSARARAAITGRFRDECILLSKLRHPNIVQFIGVHYGRTRDDLTLVMECLYTDLDKCLEKCVEEKRTLPLPLQLSILLDVAYGLLYLHFQEPLIIHRDLKAENVLLTPDMRAKLADLGVSKILDLHPLSEMAQTICPGSPGIMPPEALVQNPEYDEKLDDFSFGTLALNVVNHEFATPYEVPLGLQYRAGEVHIARRMASIIRMGRQHCLYDLVIRCLQDDPKKRPTTAEICATIERLTKDHPQKFKDVLEMHTEIAELLRVNNQWDVEYKEQEAAFRRYREDSQRAHSEHIELIAELKEKQVMKLEDQLDKLRLENELAPLREERAALLTENEQLQKRDQLELETMRQKCDAWRGEVERLAPLRMEADQLRAQVMELKGQIDQVTQEKEGLGKQLQDVLDESERKQSEMARKVADYDRLREWVTELRQIRANLENELAPLREERAAILTENAQLREGSQPENYAKLREEYASLAHQFEQLQTALQEQAALVQRHEKTNTQLRQQVNEATNPEQLQSVRDRLERYRGERDQARLQNEELQTRLHQIEMESQQNAADSQQLLSRFQQEATSWEHNNSTLAAKVEEYEGRMRRYREERNQAITSSKAFEQLISTLQGTINELLQQTKPTVPNFSSLQSGNPEPLRMEADQLRAQVMELKGQIDQVTQEKEGLGKQLQDVLDESERKQSEMARKVADYDRLREWVTELRQIRANLENELAPLREERAAILTENAQLREGSQPENYAKLREEYASLAHQFEQLQTALQEQAALVQRHEKTNAQLQQQLNEATNPEQLQSVRDRLERYRGERDQARLQNEELQTRLHQIEMESQQNAADSQQLLSRFQQEATSWEHNNSTLAAKVEEYEGRMRRFREERNQAITSSKAFEQQISTLQGTINELLQQTKPTVPNFSSLQSGNLESVEQTSYQHHTSRESSLSPTHRSETTDTFPEHPPYAPQDYTGLFSLTEGSASVVATPEDSRSSHRLDQQGRKPRPTFKGKRKAPSFDRSGSSFDESGPFPANVKAREGVVQIYIHRPLTMIGAEHKPQVVVKRVDGEYERGTLMFTGKVQGIKDIMAGVMLEIPRASGTGYGTNDGTYKDGKMHFRCTPGHGLYAPLSKVYVEAIEIEGKPQSRDHTTSGVVSTSDNPESVEQTSYQHHTSRESSLSPTHRSETADTLREHPPYSPQNYPFSLTEGSAMATPEDSRSSHRHDQYDRIPRPTCTFEGKRKGPSFDRSGSSFDESGPLLANVKAREGVVQIYIQRPLTMLNAKQKPPVVVERSNGEYERGTLMYTGKVQGIKDLMAGVQLEIPRASGTGYGMNDGTYRDGKMYFKCLPGYGLYAPLSKVYVEAK